MSGDTAIEAGVTVTLAPGTVLRAAQGTTLRVRGTLLVAGEPASVVQLLPGQGATGWTGITAESGATVTLRHVVGDHVATLVNCQSGATCSIEDADFHDLGVALLASGAATVSRSRFVKVANGGLTVNAGGELSIVDSKIMTSTGDLIVQTGGALRIEYSEIGGTIDSEEHCDVHVGGAEQLSITRSNLISAAYGMMIGGVSGAVIQYNNFRDNGAGTDISEVGAVSDADLRFNYWDQGAPQGLGAAYDLGAPAPAVIEDAGPRVTF
jgi:hypothetical protein